MSADEPRALAMSCELPPELGGSEPVLDPGVDEVLTLLIEECAEVIQRCTKNKRIGIRSNPWTGKHNRDQLELELGDVSAAVRILHCMEALDMDQVEVYREQKVQALRQPDGRLRVAKVPEDA